MLSFTGADKFKFCAVKISSPMSPIILFFSNLLIVSFAKTINTHTKKKKKTGERTLVSFLKIQSLCMGYLW